MTDPWLEPLLGFRDAALRLGVSTRTVRRFIEAGVLDARELPNGRTKVTSASVRALATRLLDESRSKFHVKHI